MNDDYDGTDVGVTARAKLALAASVGLTPAAIAIALGLLLGGCMTPQARGALYMGDHSGLAPTATAGAIECQTLPTYTICRPLP